MIHSGASLAVMSFRLKLLFIPEILLKGTVFVFCTEECGIHRWTEGLAWTPSRIGTYQLSWQVLVRAHIDELK